MKLENKRIFISDLPETTTSDELENAIKNYGNVKSIEIKERKELGLKNTSLFFAYINVEIDDRSLQQCFKDFSNGKWCSNRIALQIARESFLDRLKREREETVTKKDIKVLDSSNDQHNNLKPKVTKTVKLETVKKYESSDSESEKTDSSFEDKKIKNEGFAKVKIQNNVKNSLKPEKEENNADLKIEIPDLVIKNNKGKSVDKNGLKIESVGKSPILTIDNSKKKPIISSSEANLKRLQSLSNLKKVHKTQKSLIQQALSKIDNKTNSRIIFDDTQSASGNKLAESSTTSKKALFDDEPQDDDFEPNFKIKEQFEGEKGQKLLNLQSRYKNDKRFVLDARFLEEDESQEETIQEVTNEEMSLEEEKKKEYEILEQILGKKVTPKTKTEMGRQQKSMLRFDPSHPEHSKFELKHEAPPKEKKKRKRQNSESDILKEKKQEEKEAPEVSKEVFYKVTDDLKNSLKEKQEFSLLSMFGKADEQEQEVEQEAESSTQNIVNGISNFAKEKNPFRYDSSDDEDQTEDIPNTEDVHQTEVTAERSNTRINNRSTFWTEPFFFTDDDYRLQEGVDFVERISSKEDDDFRKLRRDLKEIVKAKVRNNQRKNRPFKKKLGGSKKKKMLRIKKALKR